LPAQFRLPSIREPIKNTPFIARHHHDGTDSDYGILREVLVASPQHLTIVPCNKVSENALEQGCASCTVRAGEQHRGLVKALENAGVRSRVVKPVAGLPDLAFTRDTSLMSPWGLIGLRPGAPHRRGEVDAAIEAARAAGHTPLGRVNEGRVEGGDVCLLRPGHLVIGLSERRTDQAGARALSSFFEPRGWRVTTTPVDPDLLHLDTHFCMVSEHLALACTARLQPAFLDMLDRLGIELIDVTAAEVATLGCNILSLGGKRVISTGSAPRVDRLLEQRGYEVQALALDEFTQCGGGVHCLTMPLRRNSPLSDNVANQDR